MTPTLLRFRRLVLLLPLLSGCAGVPARIESRAPPTAASAVVLVVDGAGGYQTAVRSITSAVDSLNLPVYVRSFDWTHGRGLGLADMVDSDYAHCQGRVLAEEVCRIRKASPGVPVSVVGFSAGGAVVLAAADFLPPDSVERIVLLAPAVSAFSDLHRPLAAARQGVDVFSSERDRWWLGLGTAVVGTADGKRGASAGRVGFRGPLDPAFAARLHAHPWNPSVAWTGNNGGHTGSLSAAYLKAFVLPLFAQP